MSAEVLITAENWPNWYLMSTKCRVNWSGQEELRFARRCPEPCLPAFPWELLRAWGWGVRGVWFWLSGACRGTSGTLEEERKQPGCSGEKASSSGLSSGLCSGASGLFLLVTNSWYLVGSSGGRGSVRRVQVRRVWGELLMGWGPATVGRKD